MAVYRDINVGILDNIEQNTYFQTHNDFNIKKCKNK